MYGHNNSFSHYASNLLDAASVLCRDWPKTPPLNPDKKSQEIPFRLRGALGALLEEGKPITADWALAWYLAAPGYGLRTSARRCFTEFVGLFRQRFAVVYPQGLRVVAPRRCLSARYQAASGTFSVQLKGPFERLPDVIGLSAPVAKINQIVNDCASALDPYSRLVARDPAARDTITAQCILPEELLRNLEAGSALAVLKSRLETLVPRTSALVRYADIRQLLEIESDPDKKVTKQEAVAVAVTLERLGFETEPDPRFGGPTPPSAAKIMLFRGNAQCPVGSASPQFLAARSNIEIAVLVVLADGKIDDIKTKNIIARIRFIAGLSDFERVRLIAYLGFLISNPPEQRIIARLKESSLEERRKRGGSGRAGQRSAMVICMAKKSNFWSAHIEHSGCRARSSTGRSMDWKLCRKLTQHLGRS